MLSANSGSMSHPSACHKSVLHRHAETAHAALAILVCNVVSILLGGRCHAACHVTREIAEFPDDCDLDDFRCCHSKDSVQSRMHLNPSFWVSWPSFVRCEVVRDPQHLDFSLDLARDGVPFPQPHLCTSGCNSHPRTSSALLPSLDEFPQTLHRLSGTSLWRFHPKRPVVDVDADLNLVSTISSLVFRSAFSLRRHNPNGHETRQQRWAGRTLLEQRQRWFQKHWVHHSFTLDPSLL